MTKDISKKILNILEAIVLISVCFFCIFALLQKTILKDKSIFGYRTYVVVSDSMSPELVIGDVILIKETELQDIKVGDVLTYEGMVSDYAGKIITHRVKSIAIEDGEYIFYCQGVNNTLSDPAVYSSQIVGVMTHRFVLLSFFSKIIRNSIGFVLLICIPLLILLLIEVKSMGKEIKEDVKVGKKEKKKKEDYEEKLKNIEARKQKLLESINSDAREIKESKKIKTKKIVEEEPKEEVNNNIKSLDSYDEDYLEIAKEEPKNEEDSILDEFRNEDIKKSRNKKITEEPKEEIKEDKFNLRIEDNSTPITEDELLDSTSNLVVPIKVSDGLIKKKATIKSNSELTNLKRRSRGIEAKEVDITNEIDYNSQGYDITSDIEDDLEKTKEFDFSALRDIVEPKKSTKRKNNEKNNKKDANYDLPKLK